MISTKSLKQILQENGCECPLERPENYEEYDYFRDLLEVFYDDFNYSIQEAHNLVLVNIDEDGGIADFNEKMHKSSIERIKEKAYQRGLADGKK